MHAVSPISGTACSRARGVFRAGRRVTHGAARVVRVVSRNELSVSPEAPKFGKKTPAGDERERDVCLTCGFVDYRNPKVVVGCVPCWTDSTGTTRVLLCRRAIEPRVGKWGFPQGFMELGEGTRDGAARETKEEAGAAVTPGPLLAVYNLPGQVQLLYLAEMLDASGNPDTPPVIACGIETLEAKFFNWDEIPHEDDLAFATVSWALAFAALKLDEWQTQTPFVPQQRQKLIFGDPMDGKTGWTEEG